MADRRELTIAHLDDVMDEVERLLAGHETAGRWSLGQICNHLSTGVRLSIEVPPDPTAPAVPDVFRIRFFRSGRFPDGREVPHPLLLPAAGLDARTEADALRAALGRFASSDGPFLIHPRLGTLTKDEWDLFHRMHCAHHLGFAVPRASAG